MGYCYHYDAQSGTTMCTWVPDPRVPATPPAPTPWQTGDRFRGSASGRTGTVTVVTRTSIGFLMDDSVVPGNCERSLFEKHAVRIDGPPTQRSVHSGPVTCRGCSTVNEYAESDQGDSTYICGSCRSWR